MESHLVSSLASGVTLGGQSYLDQSRSLTIQFLHLLHDGDNHYTLPDNFQDPLREENNFGDFSVPTFGSSCLGDCDIEDLSPKKMVEFIIG